MEILDYLLQAAQFSLKTLAIGLLPYLIFAFLMQKISISIRRSLAALIGDRGYIYITALGVMLHELSHEFFCVVFRHKINEMKLFSPETDGTLGYVNHSYNPKNRFQRMGNFFIGTGPVWGGIFALCLLTMFLVPAEITDFSQGSLDICSRFFKYLLSASFWCRWQSYLWLYLILTVSSHVTLSTSDLTGSIDGAITIITTVILAFTLFGWCGNWEESVIGFCQNVLFATADILLISVIMLSVFAIVLKIIAPKR